MSGCQGDSQSGPNWELGEMFHVISAACNLGSCKHACSPGPGAEAGSPSAALSSGKGLYILLYLMWAASDGILRIFCHREQHLHTCRLVHLPASLCLLEVRKRRAPGRRPGGGYGDSVSHTDRYRIRYTFYLVGMGGRWQLEQGRLPTAKGIKLDFQSGDAEAGKVAQLIKALAAI